MKKLSIKRSVLGKPTTPAPVASQVSQESSKERGILLELEYFDRLPDSKHVRLPVVAAWRGISGATVWRHVKAGLLPAPVKLGPNTTAWRVGDLRRALAEQEGA